MMKIIIATVKSWNIENVQAFSEKHVNDIEVHAIDSAEILTSALCDMIEPDYIFFPHWSAKIPSELFEKYKCIVFHMTDLPYGRGGSPLQNLILRGHKDTVISALQVSNVIDGGDIYMKSPLTLDGTADEIFIRASRIIFDEMMPTIIYGNIVPYKQEGESVTFKRRKPEESEILSEKSLDEIYDHIRMLDGEGYPNAFIRFGKYKLSFSQATIASGKLQAQVEIVEEEK